MSNPPSPRRRALPTALLLVLVAAVSALPADAAVADPAPAPAPVPTSRATAPADHPTYIVTVRRGLDPDAVARAYGITPVHVFRTAMNGFAAPLSPGQVKALRATDALVESVEQDGFASSGGPATA
ncbi:protease inhibitor I9 family protein [Streptomyces sp. NPDC059835]|uniref:protease inhibitor I9 family protein n=1 Tax=Streptomyces sp. NPDC059835 TaxID=3346967 RepID=UPI0036511E51